MALTEPIPSKRILVVEDEPLAAQAIRAALGVEGHTVEIAEDGEQALVKVQTSQYDLVITDFKLPKMDGLELAQAIKERSPQQPIILITAYAVAINESRGKVTNVDLLLKKPISMADLEQALSIIFSAR